MDAEDPRLGDIITKIDTQSEKSKFDIMLIGYAEDEGVRRNGGRVGARDGPGVFRKQVQRIATVINPEYGSIDISKYLKIGDLGDVSINELIKESGEEQTTEQDEKWFDLSHEKLQKKVSQAMGVYGSCPFVIGGGNDQSFSNGLSFMKSVNAKPEDIAIVNIDAHLDVRKKKNGLEHSGSPFRRLLETKLFDSKNFVEFAAQGTQCSQTHVDYVTKQNNGKIYWLSSLKENGVINEFKNLLNELPENVFISFDIDSIQSSDCPGVSCPATIGISSQEALTICYLSGLTDKVKIVDVSEFNPKIDDYRTGRLVANMFAYFTLGRAKNKQLKKDDK